MTFVIPFSQPHPLSHHRWASIGICGGCGVPVAFEVYNAATTQHPHAVNGDIEVVKYRVPEIWPKQEAAEIPRHLPEEFMGKLLEAEKSFMAHINTGAAGLYRSLVDSTTKRQLSDAEFKTAGTLEARIDRLAEKHLIPDSVATWAHEVRVIANEALHDEPTVSREDAEAARNFALTYLRYAFELPGDVAARRSLKAALE